MLSSLQVSPIPFGSIMAKDCTTRTLVRSRSKENSLNLPSEMDVVHPEVSSTENGNVDGTYFDVLLPVQGRPVVKAESPAVVAKTTSESPVPNVNGSGNAQYFDVLIPKHGSNPEEVHMPICVPEEGNVSGYASSDNLETLSSDGGSRTSSVVISERALSVSSTSSFSSSHASPVYENVTHSSGREKSCSLSPNHSRPPSSADVREDWVLPRHRGKLLDRQGSSFDESQRTGEHSNPVQQTHTGGRRARKSMEESCLQRETTSSRPASQRPKTSHGYINLEAVNDAVSRVTSGTGQLAVSDSGRGAPHKTAGTEYVNISVKEMHPKQPSSSVGGHRVEEYVNVELTSSNAKRGSRQSLGVGTEYVNVDTPVLRSMVVLGEGSKADHLVLMDYGGVNRRSKEETGRRQNKRSNFRHARSHSCDNVVDVAEDVSEMRTTRSRSNALTETCSPIFRRWKLFGSRESLLESPAEKNPPTVTVRGTVGLNYVTVDHTYSPKKVHSQSESKPLPERKSASFKVAGSGAEPDVNYVQIDAIATRAVNQTLTQRKGEIAAKMKKYSNKATTLC